MEGALGALYEIVWIIIRSVYRNVNIVLATALPSGIPHDNILAR